MPARRRIAAEFSPEEFEQIAAAADRLQVPAARLVAQLVRTHLGPDPEQTLGPTWTWGPTRRPAAAPDPERARRPAWLPPAAPGQAGDWEQQRQEGIQALRERYPFELQRLPGRPEAWLKDELLLEQLTALWVWRAQLDAGQLPDLQATTDFARALVAVRELIEHRHKVMAKVVKAQGGS